MLHGLFIASLIGSCYQILKETFTTTIPDENWANRELQHKDIMAGVPMREVVKNAERGKYKLTEVYPEPHRNVAGKIVIENCLLYNQDLNKYGAVQTMKWADQGKYNLTPEELKKEKERIRKAFGYDKY